MEFSDWITKKYIEWRGDAIGQERSITKFADKLKVTHSLMTQWMKKGGKVPNSQKYISALIKEYGVEVYDILGIPRPAEDDVLAELPPEMAEDVRSFLAEVRSSEINKGKTEASPEDLEKIKQMFSKHLGKYTSTEQ
ncbi:MAG TPA: hypothetical protein DIW44_12370 [Anaerolineaceae bacterium]|nr:hypothetical protein [Anaerolineaceae bacterium]